jgi:hypothetical protein
MNLVTRPVLGEVDAGYLLLGDEFHRGIRRMSSQVAQVDEVEHLVDFIELVLVVRPLDDRSGRESAIAQVLCEQALRVLREPL